MSAARQEALSGPNVVFILSDDQGPWAAGCYGNPEIQTPNIDALAESGVRFSNFFVATPVCSPSRATFLTGRIPSQHGIHDWLRSPANVGAEAVSLTRGEVAYTDIMAKHGYACGISGKWHLGDSQRPQHSFEFWYVHQQGSGDYNRAPMVREGNLVTESGYITDIITDEALKFMEAHQHQPFYLSVHYTAPHSPWVGHPQVIVDSYADCPFESCPQESRHPWATEHTDRCLGNREMLKGYFAAVTAMDGNVGRILERGITVSGARATAPTRGTCTRTPSRSLVSSATRVEYSKAGPPMHWSQHTISSPHCLIISSCLCLKPGTCRVGASCRLWRARDLRAMSR
jgi:arylsulfatase A-like enzyme